VTHRSRRRTALEKARAEHPHLIVLDIMMPKLDGYETCKALKSDESTARFRDSLSAKGRNVDQKIGFEVGADDYITKPFSPPQAWSSASTPFSARSSSPAHAGLSLRRVVPPLRRRRPDPRPPPWACGRLAIVKR